MSQPLTLNDNSDRRLADRVPLNQKATLLLDAQGSAIPCTLMDLCLDGCCLQTDADVRVDPGARLELAFRVSGAAFRMAGLVEWSSPARQVGVLFTGISARREAELVELLGDLAAAWQAERADGMRAEAALKAARELAQQRAAEFEAATAREAALRTEAEQAAAEARQARQKLETAKKELALAEKSAAEHARRAPAVLQAARPASVPALNAATAAPDAARPAAENGQSAPKPTGRERRQAQRHAVDSNATVFLVDVRSNLRGRIVDVSLGGCRIRFAEKFPVGIYRRVELEFLLDGLPFRLPGVVQSLHDHLTAGIRFVDLSERKREQLLFVIEEMNEMARGEEG